jgi:hypothetical protein
MDKTRWPCPTSPVTRYYGSSRAPAWWLTDGGTINYYSKSGTERWMRALNVYADM